VPLRICSVSQDTDSSWPRRDLDQAVSSTACGWIGAAQRSFDMMCAYALSGNRLATISKKQSVQNWIADSAQRSAPLA